MIQVHRSRPEQHILIVFGNRRSMTCHIFQMCSFRLSGSVSFWSFTRHSSTTAQQQTHTSQYSHCIHKSTLPFHHADIQSKIHYMHNRIVTSYRNRKKTTIWVTSSASYEKKLSNTSPTHKTTSPHISNKFQSSCTFHSSYSFHAVQMSTDHTSANPSNYYQWSHW